MLTTRLWRGLASPRLRQGLRQSLGHGLGHALRHALPPALGLLLAACGGGGGDPGKSPFPAPPAPAPSPAPAPATAPATALPGVEGASAGFAQRCAIDNLAASASQRSADRQMERRWLRAYLDEAYLWRDQVPTPAPSTRFDVPTHSDAMDAYFQALLTPALTPSGKRLDRFSFTVSTAEWQARTQNAQSLSHGVEWQIDSPTPPRRIRVALVQPGSPAERAGLRRGDQLLSVNGVSADTGERAGVDVLNAALFPAQAGVSSSFTLQRPDGSSYQATATAGDVVETPVPLAQVLPLAGGRQAGYLLFNSHVLPAEGALIAAMRDFQRQGVSELVVDLRYNGGGYLFLASELAYMVAGSQQVLGRPFERLRYNSRRQAEDVDTPFYATACAPVNARCTRSDALPALNLRRVYVLAQSGTCSASESFINGLRGIDVEVVLIGGSTCGKPYGFVAQDNCGISYLPIEFVGANAKGFGDYGDGLEPGPASPDPRRVPGCRVADDLNRALGNPQEAMLATALAHMRSGQCEAVPASPAEAEQRRRALSVPAQPDAAPLIAPARPLHSNRFVGGRP